MRRANRLLALTISVSVAVGTLAVPVAAASTKVHVVNGIPGKQLAVCINGKRVKKALPYGKKVTRTTSTAKARVKILRKGPRTARCRGNVVARRTIDFQNAIMIVTKRDPNRVMVLEFNTGSTGIGVRQMSDIGTVLGTVERNEIFQSASTTPMSKGEAIGILGLNPTDPIYYALRFTEIGGAERLIAGPRIWVEVPGRLRAAFLVGTKFGNARIVSFLL